MTGPFILGSEVEPGRYIALRTGSPFGAVVRAFTGSEYDHVIIPVGGDECVEATTRGVKRSPLSKYRNALAAANVAEDMTGLARLTVVKTVERYVGDEYAFPGITVIGLRKLGLTWGWLPKASNDRDAVFCSELVALGGQAAGLDWLCGTGDPALVTPGMLAVRRGMRRITIT
jgi:hypothetical protein